MRGVPDLDNLEAPSFSILTCSNCGTACTSPAPTESTIALLYTKVASSDYEYPEPGLIGRLKDAFARSRVRKIVTSLPAPPKTILDYGTGAGRFASAVAAALPGSEVVGTDFDERPPLGSYYESDPKIRYVPYRDVANLPIAFDLIIARHVLEHVHHPIDLIRKLSGMLSHDGMLYIEVPNLSSRTAKMLGSKWPLLYVPRHLSHFTRETLRSVIRRAGVTARLGRCEMPMMGNVVALKLGRSRFDPAFRPLALLLYPLQLVLENLSGEGTCLVAFIKRVAASSEVTAPLEFSGDALERTEPPEPAPNLERR